MKQNKTEKIISALLSYPTVREAAKSLKMAESTLYNYLKDDEFKAKYSEAKTAILQQSTGYLQSNMAKATENIVKLIDNEETAPQTRLNASRTVLEYGIKLTESIDILPRIELLEKAQAASKD
jgi:hypothetical protein